MDKDVRLAVLLCSEEIRKVDRGEKSPHDLDEEFKKMRSRIRELEHIRLLNQSEIVNLRRQIELLVEG